MTLIRMGLLCVVFYAVWLLNHVTHLPIKKIKTKSTRIGPGSGDPKLKSEINLTVKFTTQYIQGRKVN